MRMCVSWLPGYCVVASGGQVRASTNVASGTVCDGWDRPVTDLMALGLMDDVLRRLRALPPADRVVYVTGHSRGGALVGGMPLRSAIPVVQYVPFTVVKETALRRILM
jgi:hypothetical protein